MTTSVVFCHPGVELYGSDRMAATSVSALIDGGMDVTVILPTVGPLTAKFEEAGARVVVEDMPVLRKALMRPGPIFRLLWKLPRVLRRARTVLERYAPDVVYVNTITQPWWLHAARKLKVPAIAHVREAESDVGVMVNNALYFPLRLARTVICNSQATLEQAVRSVPKIRSRARVIYNGKDWGSYLVSPFTGVSAAPVLLFLGRLNPRKGPDTAIRALAELVARGIDAHMIIAGSVFPGYEWYEREIRELSASLGVEERCEFIGFVDDVASTIARADIVVVPSLVEPFGTVAAEGMSGMRPTIVARTQGLVEIVSDGETGLVFDAGDEKALADCCERLIDDPELAMRLATAGRESVVSRFSLTSYNDQTVNAVRDVVG